jgi:hypothetical protein
VQNETGALMSHVRQDDPDGPTATRSGTGAPQNFPKPPATSAANDNDCEGPRSQVPLSTERSSIPSGQPEPTRGQITEGACPSIPCEEVTNPQAVQAGSSWRARLGMLAYVAAVSVAMFGWLYLLWLALVSSM